MVLSALLVRKAFKARREMRLALTSRVRRLLGLQQPIQLPMTYGSFPTLCQRVLLLDTTQVMGLTTQAFRG
jgi:hypothetical protein